MPWRIAANSTGARVSDAALRRECHDSGGWERREIAASSQRASRDGRVIRETLARDDHGASAVHRSDTAAATRTNARQTRRTRDTNDRQGAARLPRDPGV